VHYWKIPVENRLIWREQVRPHQSVIKLWPEKLAKRFKGALAVLRLCFKQ
jgi:hypothetical protein